MTICPSILKGDEFPDDTPLKVQNTNLPKTNNQPLKKTVVPLPMNEVLYERLN